MATDLGSISKMVNYALHTMQSVVKMGLFHAQVDTFWQKFNTDPSHATRAIVLMGGSGSGF